MKNFITQNWYRLMIGSSLLMASFGFMIYTIKPASAKSMNSMPQNSNCKMVPTNADGTISVRLSDDQLNKIIPKNEDGSINITLSKQQLDALTPNAVQDINLVKINGWGVWAGSEYDNKATLGVTVRNP